MHAQIARVTGATIAEGRRGACREYLLNTAEHARSLGIHDPYLEELVTRVVRLREEQVPDIALA